MSKNRSGKVDLIKTNRIKAVLSSTKDWRKDPDMPTELLKSIELTSKKVTAPKETLCKNMTGAKHRFMRASPPPLIPKSIGMNIQKINSQ